MCLVLGTGRGRGINKLSVNLLTEDWLLTEGLN